MKWLVLLAIVIVLLVLFALYRRIQAGEPPEGGAAGPPASADAPPVEEGPGKPAGETDPSRLASPGTLDSEIAELEGERPDPDES